MTYSAFLDTDVLLGLEGHEAHFEVGGVETLRGEVEHLLELERLVSCLDHCVFCF